MSRTRATLAAGAAGALLLSLGAGAYAAKPQRCSKTVAGVVHAADQTAAGVPVVGATAESLVHGVVEPVACALPV